MQIVAEEGLNDDSLLSGLSYVVAGITTLPNSIKCHLGPVTMCTIICIVKDLIDNLKN
jgi:hypothetical protein